LDEHLSIEDVYDILEVATVDSYNMQTLREAAKRRG
jgi:hypothetical protein